MNAAIVDALTRNFSAASFLVKDAMSLTFLPHAYQRTGYHQPCGL
jgi:hypothetical protein